MTSRPAEILIDGQTLTLESVLAVVRGGVRVALAPEARARLERTRAHIETHWMRDDAPLMYGFNTGVGLYKDVRIPVADMAAYQEKMILAHASGVGAPFAEEVARATLLLRANAFASDHSGPQTALVERLLDFVNAGLHPVMPEKGSVGASGDLAPLAHLAAAVCGWAQGEIFYRGQRLPAAEAITAAGLPVTFTLGAKDASALINGSTVSLALAVLALADARNVRRHADLGLVLSLEALRGELAAFDPEVQAARPHPGQLAVAANVLRLAGDSRRCSQAARDLVFPEESRAPGEPAPPRVQDVYALRCAPQVHGPVVDALAYIERILTIEMNAATDNPLILPTEAGYRVLSAGHFHGQYVAQAMDLLTLALADLGAICERRLARLIDPTMSYGLPRNLNAGRRGLNTGFATVQCSMSALVMENRTLATPGSVDSVPGKSNSEDHVSNATWCARKARIVVGNVAQIVAVELLMAAQALTLVAEIGADFPLGTGSQAVLEALRAVIPAALDGDRWYAAEMAAALEMLHAGHLIAAAEQAVGELA